VGWTLDFAAIPGLGMAMGGNLSSPVALNTADAFLRAAFLDGLDDVKNIQLHKTTFRGRPALAGTFDTTDGLTLHVLEFLNGTQRMYGLAAVSQSALSQLEASFVALP
jgi:hypothetical protein